MCKIALFVLKKRRKIFAPIVFNKYCKSGVLIWYAIFITNTCFNSHLELIIVMLNKEMCYYNTYRCYMLLYNLQMTRKYAIFIITLLFRSISGKRLRWVWWSWLKIQVHFFLNESSRKKFSAYSLMNHKKWCILFYWH